MILALVIKYLPTLYKYRVYVVWFILLVSYPITYYTGYGYGYADGEARIEYVTVTKYIERVGKRNEKKKQIRSLDNDALLRKYCKWVSDMPYDECVRTYRFVE